MSIFCFS